MRYIAVDREVLRRLLFEDGSLSDLLLSAFVERRELLQQRARGSGSRSSARATRPRPAQLVEFARRLRLPHSWLDPDESEEAAALVDGARRPRRSRWCASPAAASCGGRATASSRGRSGSGSSWRRARRSTC